MLWYAIRLSIVLAFVTTTLVVVMPGLEQMTPRGDWIVYWDEVTETTTASLQDLERGLHVPLFGISYHYSYLLDFSSQGKLAFSLISNRQTEVQVFDVWSSVKNPVSVFTDPNIMEFLQFSWSPDGRYLAFVGRDHVGNSRLYVWDGESTRSLHSLEFDIDSGSVFWSVDNQLAFSLRLQGLREEQPWPNDIYLWDGHQTINLSQTPDREERVILWSRGGHLAYTSRVTHSDSPVVVMVWDGINFIQISPDFVNLYWIGWNNDNEMTLSGVRQLSDTQMQMYRWDGEQVINITPDPGEKYIYQIWSPDGRWAVGLIHDRAIWADELEMRDANNQLLLKMPSPRYPIWTEGGSLLFCQIQPQGWVLQQWDGKNVRPVTQNTISRVIVPNSGRLYCQ